jgi:hypothetical protein
MAGTWEAMVRQGCSSRRREVLRQGRMRTPSKIAWIAAVLALSIALTPTAASANTLLSGYGGPGQGNQAILGSALLNGPSSGGGGGGSTGGGSSSSGATNLAAPATPASAQRSLSSPRHARSGAAGKHGLRAKGSAGAANTRRAESGAAGAYNVSAGGGSANPLLGFSRDDLLYVVLGLGVLAFTGVLTRRLTGRQQASRSGSSRGAADTPTST